MTAALPRRPLHLVPAVLAVGAALLACWVAASELAGRELWEVGDLAGDALQARLLLSDGVLLTGHHSDVGVSHPGPAGLLVKAFAELVASRIPEAPAYVVSLMLLLGLRVLLLVWAARVVAARFGAVSAGVAFAASALMLSSWSQIDPFSVWLHFSLVWVMPPLVAALFAVREVPSALPLLALTSGLASHLHAPVLPVAVLLASFGLAVAWRRRGVVQGRVALLLGASFMLPLLLRAVSQWPWPLSYVSAAASRLDERAATAVEMPWLFSLGSFSGLPPRAAFSVLAVGFPLLVAVGVRGLCGRAGRSRWSAASPLLLAVVVATAAVFSVLSFRDQMFASELLWVAGLVQGLVALAVAAVVSSPVAGLRRFGVRGLQGAAADGLLVLLAAVVLAESVSALRPDLESRHGGMDMGFVVPASEAFASSGASGFLVSRADMVSVVLGLVLELERSGVPVCMRAVSQAGLAEDAARFLRRPCPDGAMLLRVGDEGEPGSVFSHVPPPGAVRSRAFSLVEVECGGGSCG